MSEPGERNGNAKLTTAIAQEIERKRLEGMSQRQLAREYGVSQSTISRLLTQESGYLWAS